MPPSTNFTDGDRVDAGYLVDFNIGSRHFVVAALALVSFAWLGGIYFWADTTVGSREFGNNRYSRFTRLAGDINSGTQRMLQHEKDLIGSRDSGYSARYRKEADAVLADIEKIRVLDISRDVGRALERIQKNVTDHTLTFEKLATAVVQATAGDDRKIQDPVQKAGQALETRLNDFVLSELTVKMLTIRQHEKDFILTGNTGNIADIDRQRAEFTTLLAATPIPDSGKQEISGLMDRYMADFKAYTAARRASIAAAEAASREEQRFRETLSGIFAKIEPDLKILFTTANEGDARTQVKLAEAEAKLANSQESTLWLVIGTAGLIFVILAVVWTTFSHAPSGSVDRLTAVVNALARGDKSVHIPAADELGGAGELVHALTLFKENIVRTEQLQFVQEEERETSERRAETVTSLTDGFDRSARDVLQTVFTTSTELQQTAETLATTAEQASQQVGAVSSAANLASANVETVATATEELSMSIAEIGRQVTQSAEIASSAVDRASKTNEAVRGLDEAASKIGDVVTLINHIAGQTNLLALNATIEAARAGDAGKGFAVVAQEVKNLASQTAKATDEISQQITAVQDETRATVGAIEEIMQVISEISDISTTIAAAVEQQGVSTQEIARNIQEAARGTRDVNNSIETVTKVASETGSAAGQVLSASQEMSRQAEGLRGQVDSFLSQVRAV